MSKPKQHADSLFLGIECGGTRSVAILTQPSGKEAVLYESGPANIHLLNDVQLLGHFKKISSGYTKYPQPASVAIGMAGARSDHDRNRIRTAAAKVWPKAH